MIALPIEYEDICLCDICVSRHELDDPLNDELNPHCPDDTDVPRESRYGLLQASPQ